MGSQMDSYISLRISKIGDLKWAVAGPADITAQENAESSRAFPLTCASWLAPAPWRRTPPARSPGNAIAALTFVATYGTSNAAPIAPLPEELASNSSDIVKAYYYHHHYYPYHWHHHYYGHRHWYHHHWHYW